MLSPIGIESVALADIGASSVLVEEQIQAGAQIRRTYRGCLEERHAVATLVLNHGKRWHNSLFLISEWEDDLGKLIYYVHRYLPDVVLPSIISVDIILSVCKTGGVLASSAYKNALDRHAEGALHLLKGDDAVFR